MFKIFLGKARSSITYSIQKVRYFWLAWTPFATENRRMKNYTKILFSILMAMICTAAFAADKPAGCKKTGKNCPMNDNKECNCGKSCDC